MSDNCSDDILFFRDLSDYELKSGNWCIGDLHLYFGDITFGVIAHIKDNRLTYTSHIEYSQYEYDDSSYYEVEESEMSYDLKSCMSNMESLLDSCDMYVECKEELKQLFDDIYNS